MEGTFAGEPWRWNEICDAMELLGEAMTEWEWANMDWDDWNWEEDWGEDDWADWEEDWTWEEEDWTNLQARLTKKAANFRARKPE